MRIGKREFDLEHHTYVMGILNVTPDSFSDGGSYATLDQVLFRAQEMIEQGADILDVGGESTRPGYSQISCDQELERVVAVLERLKTEFDIPLSVDTYKAQVAASAIQAGADLVNDIWGLKYPGNMAEVIAASGVACCLMHNREVPVESLQQGTQFIQSVKADLKETLALADTAGIDRNKIILDPGVGFGKTYQQNLQVIHSLNEFKELGQPLLLGTSRKSVIGLTLDLPVEQRLEGTLATTVYGVLQGCAFVRVHDVLENVRAIKMAEAILNASQ